MVRQKEKGVQLEALLDSFERGNFSPLYLLHGEEDFLIDEALDSLMEHAIDERVRGFNSDILYGGDVGVKDVVALASSFPMTAERRMVVVRDAERLTASESSREALQRYLNNPLASTILVLVTRKADMRLSVFKVFQDRGVVFEAKALYEHQIPEWITRRARRLGRTVTPEASQIMVAHVGTSLRAIENEIEKLLVYVGDKTEIDAGDVSAVVGMSKSFNIFELQRAISRGDASRSVEILERMIEGGESPVGILAILTRFFQRVWIVPFVGEGVKSEYELASALQVSPFFVHEYVAAAERYPAGRLEEMFTSLLEADVTLKSTQEDPGLVMTTLVYRLVKQAEETAIH